MTGKALRAAPNALARHVLEETDFCTFNWNSRDGWPMGATVSFRWLDDRLWFSMDASVARLRAIRRDPRASVVLRTAGLSVTVKGRCLEADDLETKRLVYRAIADKAAELSADMPAPEVYAHHLEAKGSVVLELVPEKWIAFDGRDGSVTTSPS